MSRPNASIYDVAQLAGVSIATVSRVLRDSAVVAPQTRERVLAAVQELRWRPNALARGLAGARHSAVGIVFPDLLGSYYAQLVLGYEERAVADERSVLILATHGRVDADDVVLDLADRVDGLVVMDRTVSDDVIADLELARTPLVLLARPAVGPTPAVRTENIDAAAELAGHLLAHGHRDLVFLGDPDAAPDVDERWQGFRRAHAAAGLPAPDKPVRCGFLTEDGQAAADALLGTGPLPSAVFCANDDIALGVYAAAHERGLSLPRDLAVTGWDDNPSARAVTPALTTVAQPLRDLGRRAGELLAARIAGDPAASETLPTSPVIRRSCGCGDTTHTGSFPNEEVPR